MTVVLLFRSGRGVILSFSEATIRRVADVRSRQQLRSSSSSALIVPSTRMFTVGDRAFPVAA